MSQNHPRTKGEQTRLAILETAKKLFLNQGYAATSMRKIAQAVGITPAAIYNHFAGKEEIFTTLLQDAAPYEQLFELFEATEVETAESLLRQVIHGMVQLISDHEDYILLGLVDAQERDGATLITFLPQLFPRFMAFYQRLAALDAEQGRLRDIPPFVFTRTLISLIAGYLITERVAKPVKTLNLPEIDWVESIGDIFLHGVLKPTEEPIDGYSHSN